MNNLFLSICIFFHILSKCHLFKFHVKTTINRPLSPLSRIYEKFYSENEVREALKQLEEMPTNLSTETLVEFNKFDDNIINSIKLKRNYFSILLERLFQTIDDFQLTKKLKETKFDKENYNGLKREKILILGSGWGSHAFLKSIDSIKYDITVISPRNHFLFTPMLAASAVGTVDFRSIIEPIRNTNPYVNYVEAICNSIDVAQQSVTCQSIKCEGTSCEMNEFDLNYDHLIIAVGATVNTFGIKGVREYCQFLKQIEDASKLRKTIAYCFERANVPNLAEDEIKKALSFVIVGAGPTGVEFTSELRDWLEIEGKKYYAHLLKYVTITLIEAGKSILMVFDKELQEEGLKRLIARESSLLSEGYINAESTKVLLNVGVKEIDSKNIHLSNGETLSYGFCVWAAGNGPSPLVLKFIDQLKEQVELQNKARGRIATDEWLRVIGAKNIYSIGDCSFINNATLPATAQVASQQGSYLGRLFSKGFIFRSEQIPLKSSNSLEETFQNDEYLSEKVNIGSLGVKSESGFEIAKPFQFLNLGILAYIGASEALAQINVDKKVILGKGNVGFLLWRGIYLFKQVSWRNRIMVSIDWIKGRLFGRDIGSV